MNKNAPVEVARYVDSVLSEPDQGKQRARLLAFCSGRDQAAKLAWRQSKQFSVSLLVIFFLTCICCVLVVIAMARGQMEASQRAEKTQQQAKLTLQQGQKKVEQAQRKARAAVRTLTKCQLDLEWLKGYSGELEQTNQSLTLKCIGLKSPNAKGQ